MFAHRLPLLFAALLTAARLFGAYTYSIVDPLTSITSPDPNRWFANGSPTAGTGGLSGDGSLVYKQNPPGGFSNYEVRAKLNLPSGGGSYVLYLRASDDARLTTSGGSGTFLAFEVVVEPNLVNGGCVASVKGWRRAANALSQMTTNPIPCYSGMEVRAVAMAGSQVVFFVDGVYYGYWADYVVMSGRPGIGGFGMGAGNSISRVDLGPIDSIAPSAVPISSVATAVFANRVEFQWPGVADDANGIGIWGYNLFRNGSYIGVRQSPEMVDESAQPDDVPAALNIVWCEQASGTQTTLNGPQLQGSGDALNPFAQQLFNQVAQANGSLTTPTPYWAFGGAATAVAAIPAAATAAASGAATAEGWGYGLTGGVGIVLGSCTQSPNYIQAARAMGANVWNIPMPVWTALAWTGQLWTANRAVLEASYVYGAKHLPCNTSRRRFGMLCTGVAISGVYRLRSPTGGK
jgi:hypothetical protein